MIVPHSAPTPYIPNSVTVTKTVHVDGNRTDPYTEDGSEMMPYKTIQAAITVAVPTSAIVIELGTYNEDLTLKAGVYLKSRLDASAYGVTITGKLTYSSGAGMVLLSGIYVFNTSDHAVEFIGADAQKLIVHNCKFETNSGGAHHALVAKNTNPGSEIRTYNALIQVLDSSGGAKCIDTDATSAGSIGLENTYARITDDIDNVAVDLNGAIAYWQTIGEISGRVVVALTASATLGTMGLYSLTQPCLTTNSAGATGLASCLISTTASPAVTGAGVFGYTGVSYLSSGAGFAATLNGGMGPDIGALELESGLNVVYDNTASGLAATRVKTAIDELKALIDALP